MKFSNHILSFFEQLKIHSRLPKGVVVLNPYQEKYVMEICGQFYNKYYDDDSKRTLILGINPGRLGAGLTGIPFTDPLKLEKYCGIANTLQKKAELSADYIYTMIHAYGSVEKFYGDFYFSSISPLGFTKDGKNLNYYDIPELQRNLRTFIIESMEKTLTFGINRSVCYCLGEGQNFKFLSKLNAEMNWFNRVVPLAHPRFIMQYRRKKMDEYVTDYTTKLMTATVSL